MELVALYPNALICCLLDAGRSNVLICAALVADGQASTFQEAHHIVRKQRPKAKLNQRQFQALVDWSAWRDKQKKRTN